ncbi:tyrosine-type recombinase/integrase [Aminobacter sp. BE322]|uniref:tyrosine-type recombinase/integrase n=1 Tax=unclassified Aminobacter TaxID=2644704 RepID=UPI003D1E55F9
MAKIRISKRSVDTLLGAEAGTVIRDDKLVGFQARKNANGTVSYAFEYRSSKGRGGITRRVTIGRDREGGGVLTPDRARSLAEQLASDVVAGGDPAASRAKARQVPTLNDFAKEFYEEAAKIATEQPLTAKLRIGTIRNYQSIIRKHVGPAFGNRKMDTVAKSDVAKLHTKMASTPVGANTMLECLRNLYAAAAEAELLAEQTCPAIGIKQYKKNKRERFLSMAEVERLGAAMSEAETIGLLWELKSKDGAKFVPHGGDRRTVVDPDALAALRILIFTGCRLREILHLKWDQVDLERGVLTIHGKTGRRAVLLPAPAALVLAGVPRRGVYVFPGRSSTAKKPVPRSNLDSAWIPLRRQAGLAGLRLHDLRHSFASFAASGGASLPMIGKLLGHSTPAMTARYAHLADDPVRAVAEKTAATVAAAMGVAAGGEVIEFRKATRTK